MEIPWKRKSQGFCNSCQDTSVQKTKPQTCSQCSLIKTGLNVRSEGSHPLLGIYRKLFPGPQWRWELLHLQLALAQGFSPWAWLSQVHIKQNLNGTTGSWNPFGLVGRSMEVNDGITRTLTRSLHFHRGAIQYYFIILGR